MQVNALFNLARHAVLARPTVHLEEASAQTKHFLKKARVQTKVFLN